MANDAKAVCYFEGESLDELRIRLGEYAEGGRLIVLRHGDRFFLRVTGGDGADSEPDGDADDQDINDSHPCPGSPGCP